MAVDFLIGINFSFYLTLPKMPISSYHGLRKNSVPATPWNSTKISPHKNLSRSNSTSYNSSKRPLGLPRLWNPEEFLIDDEQGGDKYSKSCPSSTVHSSRKPLVNSRPRSARSAADRRLKRRDTFPKFASEFYRNESREYRRSKSDPSILAKKKQRKSSITAPKRPSTLWTVGKRQEKPNSSSARRRKVGCQFTVCAARSRENELHFTGGRWLWSELRVQDLLFR